jgi:hypothetical protein
MLTRFASFVAVAALVLPAIAQGPKGKLNPPTITCAGAGTSYIDIQVTAGASGAPAGFSLQWMTCADFAQHQEAGPDLVLGTGDDITVFNTWFSSDDTRLCKASFSGNAHLSRYNLNANESVTVRVGDLLLDEGASTTCEGQLTCGTCYVFRSFAHATSSKQRSDFTPNLQCSTLSCGPQCDPAVKSQGFWKTHEPETTALVPGTITIGCQNYTAAQLDAILDTPVAGNHLIALMHQVIATKLNLLNGAGAAYAAAVAADLAAAEALLCNYGAVPPVGTASIPSGAAGAADRALAASLTLALDGHIHGLVGECP